MVYPAWKATKENCDYIIRKLINAISIKNEKQLKRHVTIYKERDAQVFLLYSSIKKAAARYILVPAILVFPYNLKYSKPWEDNVLDIFYVKF